MQARKLRFFPCLLCTFGNLLEILDNVIHQLDFSKKLLVIMLASFFTVVPITAIVINVIANRSDLQFVIPIVTVLVFVV